MYYVATICHEVACMGYKISAKQVLGSVKESRYRSLDIEQTFNVLFKS